MKRYESAILALALLLRVAWAVAVPVAPVSDGRVYDRHARELAAGQGYRAEDGKPTAYWPVGTAFLYAVPYRAFGERYAPVVALNVVLGVAVVGLSMILAGRWFGRSASLVAGLLLACWPVLIEFTTVLASEVPFLVLMLGAWVAWTAPRPGLIARSVIAGVCLAGAAYVRPTALLLPVVFAIPEVLGRGRITAQLYQVALAAGVMGLCFTPWVLRNQRAFGEFVLISTNGGPNTWMGNSPGTTGEYRRLPEQVRGMSEPDRDRFLAGEAKAYIRAEPLAFVKRTLVKLVRLHDRETIGVVWNADGLARRYPAWLIRGLKLASTAYWWAGLALALAGTGWLVWTRGVWAAATHPAVVLWAYFAAVHAVTVIQDRYHMASLPVIAALAALALVRPDDQAAQIAASKISPISTPAT
jgi:4-amino-4-deoxy-L-arabinose transferase-like glycosyltransferase